MEEEEEEEKEVDPSLVGSLDNVYTEETEAEMMKEDPFKKAPVMDKDHVSSNYEIEETVNALLVYSSDSGQDCPSSPLPEDEEGNSSIAGSVSRQDPPTLSGGSEEQTMDLLTSPTDIGNGNALTDAPLLPGPSQELLPDVIGGSPGGNQQTEGVTPPSSNHVLPPDVTPPHGTLPPDLAAESQHPVDLLNPDRIGGRDPLDLTEGTSHGNSPDVTQQ